MAIRSHHVDAATIDMLHIHCGDPGVLGPIPIDVSESTDIQKDPADEVRSSERRGRVGDTGRGA